MNWGNRLVLVFTGFAALIGTMVYKAVHTKFDLVSKDYYSDELKYQEKIDGNNNALTAGKLDIAATSGKVLIKLPPSLATIVISADAWFYCKTNAAFDRRQQITITNGEYAFDTRSMAKEHYQLNIQFTNQHKPYYYTGKVTVD